MMAVTQSICSIIDSNNSDCYMYYRQIMILDRVGARFTCHYNA